MSICLDWLANDLLENVCSIQRSSPELESVLTFLVIFLFRRSRSDFWLGMESQSLPALHRLLYGSFSHRSTRIYHLNYIYPMCMICRK
jgi:hypothetical protein